MFKACVVKREVRMNQSVLEPTLEISGAFFIYDFLFVPETDLY